MPYQYDNGWINMACGEKIQTKYVTFAYVSHFIAKHPFATSPCQAPVFLFTETWYICHKGFGAAVWLSGLGCSAFDRKVTGSNPRVSRVMLLLGP